MKRGFSASTLSVVVALATVCLPTSAQAQDATTLFKSLKGTADDNWSKYLQDTAAGSVTAAGILDISGESVSPIENIRDVVVAYKGFSSDESKGTLAFSITPARTSLSPMSVSTYASSWPARLLGSLTLGYAQGDASLAGSSFERRAVSAETSLFFDGRRDDPILAHADAVNKQVGDCAILDRQAPIAPALAPPMVAAPSTGADTPGPVIPATAPTAFAEEVVARAAACRTGVIDKLRWNRSRLSLAYGTGWIKGKDDGASQQTLGRTLVAGLTYGFDRIAFLQESALAAVTYRRSENEPILETLQSAVVDKKDSSLATFRFTYGSPKARALFEVSDASSTRITASQRAFTKAVGLDLRVFEATWINFRFGEQHKLDGSGDEYGSIFTLSYSPTALLK